MDTTVITAGVIIMTGPELVWLGVLLASLVTMAGTTGYMLMSMAFVREHRRNAAADWRRAREEWNRVHEEREELAKDKHLARQEAGEHIAQLKADYMQSVTSRCDGPDCIWTPSHGPHLMSWHEEYESCPKDIDGLEAVVPPDTECTEHTCAYADIEHTTGDHMVCEDPNCTTFTSLHVIADHRAKDGTT